MIIASVIIGRTMIGMHFEKKFSKRPLPELIVTTVKNHNFSQKLESFGTALPSRTKSFRLKKANLLTPIKFNSKVKKGEIIAKLQSENIIAPFDGVLGKTYGMFTSIQTGSVNINSTHTKLILKYLGPK